MQNSAFAEPRTDARPQLDFRKSTARAALLVGLVALLSAVLVLWNEYVYDDLPIIVTDSRYPTFASLRGVFSAAYWPPPFAPDLWRPLASLLFGGLRLTVGPDAPWAGHLLSLLLYISLAVVVHRMLRDVVPGAGALAAAVLFAAHPVHSEAVANAVNISELVVGLVLCTTVLLYMRARRSGAPTWPAVAQLVALQAFAFGWKETGLLVPAVLGAAELTLVADTTAWRRRLLQLRPLILAFTLSSLLLILARGQILGSIKGTFTTPVLDGQPLGVRALTMLGIVVEWFRLLLWPATLRIEYSVAEMQPATTWGSPQSIGAALLLLTLAAAVVARRRLPLVTFGILFAAITIAPVHNVLFATGTILAERTLMLPSIGAACVAAALLGQIRWSQHGMARAAGAIVAVLAVAGMLRFALRLRDWRTHQTLWEQAVATEPRNAPGWQSLGVMALQARNYSDAELFLRRAAELNPGSPVARTVLGDMYAVNDKCGPAITTYSSVLALKGAHARVRLNAATCALWLGRYDEVKPLVLTLVADSADGHLFRELLHVADSARRAGVPPRTIRRDLNLTEEITYAMFPGAVRKAAAPAP